MFASSRFYAAFRDICWAQHCKKSKSKQNTFIFIERRQIEANKKISSMSSSVVSFLFRVFFVFSSFSVPFVARSRKCRKYFDKLRDREPSEIDTNMSK